MMDIDGFIQAIIDDPHDLSARLVFADFLEEIGDPRSEMIRLQFQLSELSRHDPARRAIRARELELVREHGHFGRVSSLARVLGTEGGFIDAIEITVARFLKHQSELFAESPLRGIVFTGRSKRFAKLADSDRLSQLASITWKNNDENDVALRKVLSQVDFGHLETLDIRGEWVTPGVVQSIGSCPSMEKLKHLRFDAYETLSLAPIVNSSSISDLESLAILTASDATCELIARDEQFKNLRKIELHGQGISHKGMRLVQSSRIYPQLDTLILNNGRYSYYASETATKNPFTVPTGVPKLKNLSLVGAFRTSIVNSILENFQELEVLRLSENRIDDAGAIALAESPLFDRLHKLYLTNNRITRDGAIALGEARKRNKKLKLFLDGNAISGSDANDLRGLYGKTFLSRNHFAVFRNDV